MCLIFFSLNQHPLYKLIVAGNRDEFYSRETAPAHFWVDHPHIIGGRDLEACGTWLAMNKKGRISLLTNYRDPQNINPHAPSRGQLVSDFLLTDQDAKTYLTSLEQTEKKYNGFNLIVGDADTLWYYSNYRDGITEIQAGFYGLSNHLLDTPWPKVTRGKEKLKPILTRQNINPDDIFEVLFDDQRAPDNV
jgi:uncharacterized protein with NRDE domain